MEHSHPQLGGSRGCCVRSWNRRCADLGRANDPAQLHGADHVVLGLRETGIAGRATEVSLCCARRIEAARCQCATAERREGNGLRLQNCRCQCPALQYHHSSTSRHQPRARKSSTGKAGGGRTRHGESAFLFADPKHLRGASSGQGCTHNGADLWREDAAAYRAQCTGSDGASQQGCAARAGRARWADHSPQPTAQSRTAACPRPLRPGQSLQTRFRA